MWQGRSPRWQSRGAAQVTHSHHRRNSPVPRQSLVPPLLRLPLLAVNPRLPHLLTHPLQFLAALLHHLRAHQYLRLLQMHPQSCLVPLLHLALLPLHPPHPHQPLQEVHPLYLQGLYRKRIRPALTHLPN